MKKKTHQIVFFFSLLSIIFSRQFFQVFKEDSKQLEVYNSISIHAKRLIDGYNNAIIAFGQSSSGKTTTMMGTNPLQKINTSELSVSSKANNDVEVSISDSTGMIPRMAKEIFDVMSKASPIIEFTVRVSFVEIYLEQIRDLLNPSKRFLKINDGEEKSDYERLKGPVLEGLSEICCLEWSEVVGLLFRGNSYRVVSEQRKQTDLNQSHTIFTIKIEQRNKVTERTMTSSMHLVDLAGSELEKQFQKAKTYNNTTIPLGISNQPVKDRERNIINRSHIAMKKVIGVLERYHDPSNHNGMSPTLPPHPDDIPYHESKLTRLLCNALGGNCYTTLILTASSATFNISATLATLRFGERCRRIKNFPYVNIEASPEECNQELEKSKKIQSELLILIKQIGVEMKRIKDKGQMTALNDEPLWDRLNEICESNKYFVLEEESADERTKPISLSLQDELKRKEDEINELQSKLTEARKARDKAQTQMLEMEGECVFLRNESEEVLAAKKRNTEDIIDAQNEIQRLSQLKLELEHDLRTSQFRENEAITFTRLFRRFYRKLLQNNTAHGTDNPNELILKMAGVPDLDDLIDIDVLMYESGLLEDYEVNSNMDDKEYNPSVNAIVRSSALASKAKRQARLQLSRTRSNTVDFTSQTSESRFTLSTKSENDSMRNVIIIPNEESSESPSISPSAPSVSPSAPSPSAGYSPVGQVKFPESPAGKLTEKRIDQLERDLLHITRRCIDLQMALNESEEWIELLTMSKTKNTVMKENFDLKGQLKKKESDLKALVWKMNEINIMNNTYNEKLSSKEHHINYLEEKLMKLQDKDMMQTYKKEETERKLRTEVMRLNTLLDAMARLHWQDGKKSKKQRLESRIIIPFQGGSSLDDSRREELLQGQRLSRNGISNFSETDSRDGRTTAGISYAPSFGPSVASSIYIDKNQAINANKTDDISLITRPLSQQMDLNLQSVKENATSSKSVPNAVISGGKNEFYEPRRLINRKHMKVIPAVMKPSEVPSTPTSYASSQMERQRSLNDTRKKLDDLENMWTAHTSL